MQPNTAFALTWYVALHFSLIFFFTAFKAFKALVLIDPVPLKLFGEEKYAIFDIKEVKVTDEFCGLDEPNQRSGAVSYQDFQRDGKSSM